MRSFMIKALQFLLWRQNIMQSKAILIEELTNKSLIGSLKA